MFNDIDIITEIKKLNLVSKTKLTSFLKNNDIKYIDSLLEYMDYHYHNDESLIDDMKYDIILDFVKSSKDIHKIGHKIKESDKEVLLPVFMGSINKIKPEDFESLRRWKERNSESDILISDKLDGVSCLIFTDDSSNIKMYTRGDGTKGKDITHIKPYINYIPNSLPPSVMFRGELVMSKHNFNLLEGPKVDPRNTVSGCIGSKSLRDGLSKIDLVIYECIDIKLNKQNKPSDQLEYAEMLGFKTVFNINSTLDIDIEHLRIMLKSRKEECEYEIDGIVICTDIKYIRNTERNPIYSFAFKEDISTISKVLEVIWEISRHGLIKPKVRIEPVTISGATINFATAHNALFIKENSIGKGAIIEIVRSGEVIPKIVDVIEKCDKPDFPEIPYYWNETNVEIIAKNPGDEMDIKKIVHFMTTMEVKHVSSATIRRLYDYGYDSILKILEMKVEDFMKIDRFGEKLSKRTYESIHDTLKNSSMDKLMCASSCFGFGFGVKRMKILLRNIPDIIDRYEKEVGKDSGKDLTKDILKIEGFSDITANKIIKGFPKFLEFMETVKPFVNNNTEQKSSIVFLIEEEEEDEGNKRENEIKGKKIVLSGFRGIIDKDIEKLGGEITSSVSSKTFCVVVKDKNEDSSKINKAISLNVPIYDINEFKTKYYL